MALYHKWDVKNGFTYHSELLDADREIMNLNFNGLKLKFYLYIEQWEYKFPNFSVIRLLFQWFTKVFLLEKLKVIIDVLNKKVL